MKKDSQTTPERNFDLGLGNRRVPEKSLFDAGTQVDATQQITDPKTQNRLTEKTLSPRNVKITARNDHIKGTEIDAAATYRKIVQDEVKQVIARNNQNQVSKNEQTPRSVSPDRAIHPSALGLITNQAINSGGKLTRRGVMVNKGRKNNVQLTTPSPP